jgi:hypothetical protein
MSVPAIVLGVVLLALNAFFVAAEISLLAARRGVIEERAERGDIRAVAALRALRELSVTFSGAQLGITLASLGLGAVAEPAVADALKSLLGRTALPDGVRVGCRRGHRAHGRRLPPHGDRGDGPEEPGDRARRGGRARDRAAVRASTCACSVR